MSIYDWKRCTHEGIGQPGCPTCDPDHDRVMIRAQRLDNAALRAERDALKAQVEARLINQMPSMGAELVRLRRQVEAVRALCRDQLDHGKVEADDLAGRILDAMDEAGGKRGSS